MTRKGIEEVGDLRLPSDSRERYQQRSVTNRYDERVNRETDVLFATSTGVEQVEAWVRGNADNQRRIRLPVNGDDYAATLSIKAVVYAADNSVVASISQLAHASLDGSTLTLVDGTPEVLGDSDLTISLDDDDGEVQVLVENAIVSSTAELHWVVQVDSLVLIK